MAAALNARARIAVHVGAASQPAMAPRGRAGDGSSASTMGACAAGVAAGAPCAGAPTYMQGTARAACVPCTGVHGNAHASVFGLVGIVSSGYQKPSARQMEGKLQRLPDSVVHDVHRHVLCGALPLWPGEIELDLRRRIRCLPNEEEESEEKGEKEGEEVRRRARRRNIRLLRTGSRSSSYWARSLSSRRSPRRATSRPNAHASTRSL